MIPKNKPIHSDKVRRAARGQQCALRLPGVCSHDPETVILAHPPLSNGGMGTKGSDIDGAFVCAACHDVLDGRARPGLLDREQILEAWIRATQETRAQLVEAGILEVR